MNARRLVIDAPRQGDVHAERYSVASAQYAPDFSWALAEDAAGRPAPVRKQVEIARTCDDRHQPQVCVQ